MVITYLKTEAHKLINSFHATGFFLYPLKTPEKFFEEKTLATGSKQFCFNIIRELKSCCHRYLTLLLCEWKLNQIYDEFISGFP